MNIPTIPILSGPYKVFRPLNPGDTFLEYEGSTITIPLTATMKDPNGQVAWTRTEDIQLKAFMRLEVMPPYINGLGTREFQFTIRDWDLFGTNNLLNEFFFGDPLGALRLPRPKPKSHPNVLEDRRRRQAWMTFQVARHYFKVGDDENQILAKTDLLEIDHITSHDLEDRHIYWQVEEGGKSKLRVIFHNKPPVRGKLSTLNLKEDSVDYDHLLAVAEDIQQDGTFTATIPQEEHEQGNVAFALGNTVISKSTKLRTPVVIRWKLGANPRPSVGAIRIVSPPKSIGTAHQRPEPGYPLDAADFPARIMYAASYHIHLNNVRFVEDQPGIAICDGVHEIPPRDVTVAFDKPHHGTVLDSLHVLEFGPGHCTGMHEIPEEEYRRGVQFARWCRTLPLTP
jgi:hypothetical protein